MASIEEIKNSYDIINQFGSGDLILLHCVSAYPAPLEQMNLARISLLKTKFKCEIGLSDHTIGNLAALTSIGFGVKLIEKHFTLKRSDGGVDSQFSIEPQELKKFTHDIKNAYKAIGDANIIINKSEKANLKFRRSIYAVKKIKAEEKFNKKNIRRIRPGFGLSPKYYEELLGTKANNDLQKGDAVKIEDTVLNKKNIIDYENKYK